MDPDIQKELYGMRILVVDDLEDNRDLILILLEDQGYENLLEAEDGIKALEALEGDNPVDLVLLDINMPNMNGYEVLEHINSHDHLRSIPVIMITAIDQIDSVIRCVEKGAEDYLTKPVEETLLWARVQATLERKYLRNKERELFARVQAEKKKSETVLYNVLPVSVAERLKRGEENIADSIDDVSVVFADLVGFTALSATVSAASLLHILNIVFRTFDGIAENLNLEKIKTIGDSYMVVGGLPPHREGHEERCMQFSLRTLDYIESFNEENMIKLQLRIGIHSGPVVAGVIGQTRFTYDLWGETVNLASRMETLGIPGYIQVTRKTYDRLRHRFNFKPRGQIEVKGKGIMETYLCNGKDAEKKAFRIPERQASSNLPEVI